MLVTHNRSVAYRGVWALLALALLVATPLATAQVSTFDVPQAKSALLMVAETGQLLYAKNIDEPLPPASLVKMMTLLLAFEAIERGEVWTRPCVAATPRRCPAPGLAGRRGQADGRADDGRGCDPVRKRHVHRVGQQFASFEEALSRRHIWVFRVRTSRTPTLPTVVAGDRRTDERSRRR